MLHELREGWSEFVARRWLVTMVVYFGLFQLTMFPALLVLGPTVAKEHLGGAGAWGLILACQGVGSILGGMIALRLRPRRPLIASTLLCAPMAVMLVLLGAAAPVPVLCVVGAVAALGLTLGDIVWFTTFQLKIPDHLMSRLSSFDWFGSVVLNPLGYAVVGPVAAALGVPTTLYVAGALNGLATIAVALTPAIRSGGREPVPAV